MSDAGTDATSFRAVETVASGTGEVLDFAVDGTMLYWVSATQGVRRGVMPITESSLVMSPDENLHGPIAVHAEQVYLFESYRVDFLPGIGIDYERLLGTRGDGTSAPAMLTDKLLDVGNRAVANASGVYFTVVRSAGEDVVDNKLERIPIGQTAVQTLASQRTGSRQVFRMDALGSVAAWRRGSDLRMWREGADDGEQVVASIADIEQIALTAQRVFVGAGGQVRSCPLVANATCETLSELGDAGADLLALAASSTRVFVARSRSDSDLLQVCQQGACAPAPATGLSTLQDVRVFEDRVYVLGRDGRADGGDAGSSWRVVRLNFAP